MKKHLLLILLATCYFATANAQTKKYVKPAATGTGVSWAVAGDMQTILNAAVSGDSILVAAGTYKPAATDRNVSFVLKAGVKIFGGFAGTEINFADRNPGINQTILSGDIGTTGINTDNSIFVVRGINITTAANLTVLDGCIVQDGYSSFAEDKYGGGIRLETSNVTINNCVVKNNTARYGGGIFCVSAAPNGSTAGNCVLTNSLVLNNICHTGGAGMGINHSAVTIGNTTFSGNASNGGVGTVSAGGILNFWSTATLTNCILWGNTTANTSFPDYKSILNEVAGSTTTVIYSTIEQSNLYTGVGNKNTDPLFFNNSNKVGVDNKWMTVDDGLQLSCASPAVNTGTNTGTTAKDIASVVRALTAADAADMGAYELRLNQLPPYLGENIAGTCIGTPTKLEAAKNSAYLGNASSNVVLSNANLPILDDSYTLAAWIKPTVQNQGGIVGWGNYGNNNQVNQFRLGEPNGSAPHGTLVNYWWGNDFEVNLPSNILNTWHHVACTYNNSTDIGYIYLDGVLIGTKTAWTGHAALRVAATIGTNNGNTPFEHFVGSIDEVQIWNKALTAAEINNCKQGVFCNATSELVGNYHFDEGKGNTTKNDANNTYTATTPSTAWAAGVTTLTANYPNAITWATSAGNLYRNAILTTPYVNNTFADSVWLVNNVAGNTTLIATSALSNCCKQKDTAVVNYTNPAVITGASINACVGNNINLNDYITGTITNPPLKWRAGSLTSANLPSSNIIVTATQTYFAIDSSNAVCYDTAKVTITVTPSFSRMYVNHAATGNNDGTSWGNAFTNLNNAINNIGNCSFGYVTEIWVAQGTYKPSSTGNRDSSFVLPNGIKIYGGFIGTETALAQRNWGTNQTILSGEINTTANYDNTQHVVYIKKANAQTRLDGFVIKDGYANGDGGGIFIRPEVNDTCLATIINCVITNNKANWGAGTLVDGRANNTAVTKPRFDNCIFYADTTYTDLGGAIGVFGADYNDTTTVINCTIFSNKTAGIIDATVYVENAAINLINTIVSETVSYPISNAGTGGFIETNSTINGNVFFINSNNPIGTDNKWMTADDGLHLSICSPLIDAGTNVGVATTDIIGANRIQNSTVAIGAYETPRGMVFNNTILYVNKNVISGLNNGTSWANAYANLNDAFNNVGDGCSYTNVAEIWVAQGTYKPSSTGNRDSSFILPNGIKIYGGFVGTENTLSQRNWGVNQTILSGEINSNANDDNAQHVVYIKKANAQTRLDGFVIKDGYANGDGGGIFIRPEANDTCLATIINCVLTNNKANWGAGAFVDGRASSYAVTKPRFDNCIFYADTTYNYLASAIGVFGADDNDTTTVINCTILGNKTTSYNEATVYAENTTLNLINTIVNETATNPISHAGTGGINQTSNNINENAFFINSNNVIGLDNKWMTADDGLHLLSCSALLDAGTNVGVASTDIIGANRIQNSTVAIGAYETPKATITIANTIIYVNKNVVGGLNNGTSWSNAFSTLTGATQALSTCVYVNVQQIWVAQGTYTPSQVGDRAASFIVPNGIKIYGGFVGNETLVSQRNWSVNQTILSGEINGSALDDNSTTVVKISKANANTRLDGFVIRDGFADDGNYFAAGILIQPGDNDTSLATIANCVITNNTADNAPAISFNAYTSIPRKTTFSNCVIYKNTTTANYGGTILIYGDFNDSTIFTNCTFYNNPNTAGGQFLISADITKLVLKNSLINETYTTPIQLTDGAELVEVNSSINQTAQFINTSNVIGADNKWMTADDGLHLLLCATQINGGSNVAVIETTDITGAARIQGGIVAIGAYETPKGTLNSGTKIFVNFAATGANNGTSWANAYTDLSIALTTINNCTNSAVTQIWVAKGTYKPTQNPINGNFTVANRNNSFVLPNGISMYGGFAGIEATTAARNLAVNETILSGDFNNNDIITGAGSTLSISGNSENAFNVMLAFNISTNTIIDGFTFASGNANSDLNYVILGIDDYIQSSGASIATYNCANNLKISQCVFKNNTTIYGGAVFLSSSNSSINKCSFINNASDEGAALGLSNFSDPIVTNSVFLGNNAAYNGGAVSVYQIAGNTKFVNVSFYNNNAAQNGGAIANQSENANITLKNCIVWGNTSLDSNGLYNPYTATTTATYSNIQGASTFAGSGNINTNPYFTSNTNLQLQSSSPCINIGDSIGVSNIVGNTDLANQQRYQSTATIKIIDMGAYETAPIVCGTNIAIWKGTVSNNWNNIANWQCNVLPTTTDHVIINAGATNMPLVDVNTSIKKITVNAGAAVIVAVGKTLTLLGN